MTRLRAVLWDVDGTIAETERDGHRVAFNLAFAENALPWRWNVQDYGQLLAIAGGFERILHDLGSRPGAPSNPKDRQELAKRIHESKNRHYLRLVAEGQLALRPGVERLMQECLEAGVALGVATTTGRGNVEALFPNLFGPAWRTRFSSLLCAEDASTKKPHPLVYQRSLAALGIGSSEAIAIEDSPNGLQSALAASIPTLVTPSAYFLEDPFEGATLVVPDLDAPGQYKGHEFERTHLTVLQALV